MKVIRITSNGEIDERAFSLLGASTKRDDSAKIGMFGSGLKYSLAFLLRNSIPFRVFSGYKEVRFSTVNEIFREKNFNVICVNGDKTSLTTEMGGKEWTVWAIIRELYSNAVDESEADICIEEYKSIDDVVPVEDCTAFYISVDVRFQEVVDNWDLYFSEKRDDLVYHDSKMNQLYTGGDNLIVYRKGIRCQFLSSTRSIFNYDMSWISINESRAIASDWDFKSDLTKFIKKINDDGIVHRILYNVNDNWEKHLYWDGSGNWSNTWLEQIGSKYLIPYETAGFWEDEIKLLKSSHIILPSSMVESLKIYFGDKVKVIGEDSGNSKADMKVIEKIGKREQLLIDEALAWFENADYKVEFPIKVVQFHKSEILGQAKDSTIFLSEKLFVRGKKEIVATIFEENEHNKTGYEDESRTLQNHLINMFISALEDKTGKYL